MLAMWWNTEGSYVLLCLFRKNIMTGLWTKVMIAIMFFI